MLQPFEARESREVLRTPVFRLREERRAHPKTGDVGAYYILECPDWVNVVALNENGDLVLVRQWRHGTQQVELELPAGIMENGESPEAAAMRELREETGYVPRSTRVLGWVHPNGAFQNNRCWSILAEGCRPAAERHLDAGEDIEVVLLPRLKVAELVQSGEVRSGMSLCGLLWWLDGSARVGW